MSSASSPSATIPAKLFFPEGLVGLPNLVHHLLANIPDSSLYEMMCADEPTIGFIAAAAEDVKPGITHLLMERGLMAEGEWALVLLAVHGEPPAVTANLAGPIVIKMSDATARQLVLEDPEFPLQAPLPVAG